jgi:hypothetical protein
MNKEEIKTFCCDNRDNFAIQLKRHHKQLYDKIDNLYDFPRFAEKLYVYIHEPQSMGHCKVCKSKTKFDGYWVGYREYCSYRCRSKNKSDVATEIRNCIICNGEFKIHKKRKKTTCSVDCLKKLNSTKEVNDKRQISFKRTMIEKYGIDHPSKLPDFKIKTKQTRLKNSGDENYVNIKKAKQTKLEKYGNENYNNTEKTKNTCLERYGVDNFSKTSEFKKIHFDRNVSKFTTIEPLFDIDSYDGIDKHYDFKCKMCGTVFNSYIDNGHVPICRVCNPIDRELEQRELLYYIQTLIPNVSIITPDRSTIKPQELDIHIPSLKVAFEYDGIYWHGELNGNKNKNYHLNKTEKCNKMGIRLIHIFENEWLSKTDIVRRRLKHLLNANDKSIIYARECKVEEITRKDSNEFLERYHIQGGDNSSFQFGLFFNDELVAVMTFGNYRISLGNTRKTNEYEMYRFCVGERSVVGAAGKLLSYFIKSFNPIKIVSYADRRWSNGNVYEKIGFSLSSITSPNYWYFNLKKTNKLYHRFGFRKSELQKRLQNFDPTLTEWENMKNNGYDRIWDCGNLKYEWRNNVI